MSARLVDPGAMVGAGSPTKLATIVQLDPLYVKFNIDEQQVLTVRERMREMGVTLKDLGPIPVDIGLQTETGYPHTGTLDYVAPEIDSSTGTLAGRAIIDNKDGLLEPGLFVRVRIPKQMDVESLLVPDVALGNNQQGRYLLVVDDKNVVAAAPGRGRRAGRRRAAHHQERAQARRARDRRRRDARASRQHGGAGHGVRGGADKGGK